MTNLLVDLAPCIMAILAAAFLPGLNRWDSLLVAILGVALVICSFKIDTFQAIPFDVFSGVFLFILSLLKLFGIEIPNNPKSPPKPRGPGVYP